MKPTLKLCKPKRSLRNGISHKNLKEFLHSSTRSTSALPANASMTWFWFACIKAAYFLTFTAKRFPGCILWHYSHLHSSLVLLAAAGSWYNLLLLICLLWCKKQTKKQSVSPRQVRPRQCHTKMWQRGVFKLDNFVVGFRGLSLWHHNKLHFLSPLHFFSFPH